MSGGGKGVTTLYPEPRLQIFSINDAAASLAFAASFSAAVSVALAAFFSAVASAALTTYAGPPVTALLSSLPLAAINPPAWL